MAANNINVITKGKSNSAGFDSFAKTFGQVLFKSAYQILISSI
jgi:hypothetical protein